MVPRVNEVSKSTDMTAPQRQAQKTNEKLADLLKTTKSSQLAKIHSTTAIRQSKLAINLQKCIKSWLRHLLASTIRSDNNASRGLIPQP
jgi:hypothetical protein